MNFSTFFPEPKFCFYKFDGWYFNCKKQVIRISGDVVVEPPSETPALPSLIVCN